MQQHTQTCVIATPATLAAPGHERKSPTTSHVSTLDWITDTVRELARATIADPAVASILADAVEEAGCTIGGVLLSLRAVVPITPIAAHVAKAILAGDDGFFRMALANDERADSAARTEKAKAKADKFAAAHRATSLAVGKSYHDRVADLYVSKRAGVIFGHGGEEVVDWDAYGKRGYVNPHTGRKQPAKYRNGGARIEGHDRRSARIVLENHLGRVKARLPLPPKGATLSGPTLVGGDLFSVRHRIGAATWAVRYGVDRGDTYTQCGVALLCRMPDDLRGGTIFPTNGATYYWEHGRTIAECRAEYGRKLELARAELAKARASQRLQRATRLVAAICPRMVVTVDDARAAGMCAAGIAGFCGRFGLTGTETTAATLRATGDSQVERAIAIAAERVARARFGEAV